MSAELPWHVVVLRTVMHDQLSAHKIETVGFRFPWSVHHCVLPLISQLGLGVDHLPSVSRARNHKRQLELVVLDEHIPEVVTLNHHEVMQRLVGEELQFSSNGPDVEELRAEMIANEAGAVIQGFNWRSRNVIWSSCLKKYPLAAFIQGAHTEINEVDAFVVCSHGAEELICGLSQGPHIV